MVDECEGVGEWQGELALVQESYEPGWVEWRVCAGCCFFRCSVIHCNLCAYMLIFRSGHRQQVKNYMIVFQCNTPIAKRVHKQDRLLFATVTFV